MFMVVALTTVFKTKRRSVKRRKSMKNTESGDKARFDLFKYDILCVQKSFACMYNSLRSLVFECLAISIPAWLHIVLLVIIVYASMKEIMTFYN